MVEEWEIYKARQELEKARIIQAEREEIENPSKFMRSAIRWGRARIALKEKQLKEMEASNERV